MTRAGIGGKIKNSNFVPVKFDISFRQLRGAIE